MSNRIDVLNGANLNLLGTREPEIYGGDTLKDIEDACRARAEAHGLEIAFHQTNSEGELVDLIQKSSKEAAGVILNAGAYTHTSIALYDALLACEVDAIEVHLSNPQAREEFRHDSFIAKAAAGSICGFGKLGYLLAIDAFADRLKKGTR
ncbi:MAG: type II 3-dehydroquinate dehydratase [Hyphomicrobiales bacterium]|nr:type II 3-dehydroquinate dehydratase [Hyphomicrobiales bacterium]MCY4048250.1 type II 3-dehydroquinate dehydratase [Hyphomicrobiales bacterium]